MKKTHSANIGGTVFHIEEDAYEKLQDYLQSIHAHFHFYPDVAEIVTDIEGPHRRAVAAARDGIPGRADERCGTGDRGDGAHRAV